MEIERVTVDRDALQDLINWAPPNRSEKLVAALDIQPAEAITAEQAETLRLRAELEQARVDGVIGLYNAFSACPVRDEWDVSVGSHDGYVQHVAATELDALRAACAHVADLRKPALPDVMEMTFEQMHTELMERGYSFAAANTGADWTTMVIRHRDDRTPYMLNGHETPLAFYRRALTGARRLPA